jgi:hypothetical protein
MRHFLILFFSSLVIGSTLTLDKVIQQMKACKVLGYSNKFNILLHYYECTSIDKIKLAECEPKSNYNKILELLLEEFGMVFMDYIQDRHHLCWNLMSTNGSCKII